MDHTQINASFANNGDIDDDEFLPTMFPTATDDSSLVGLNPDDLASVTRLYPGTSASQQYGTIRGVLVRPDKTAVLGANVVAIQLRAGDVEDRLHRYSCVSDYLMAQSGAFEILVLPGRYRIRLEKVRREFTGGSSVGPYATTGAGQSFRNPIKAQSLPRVVLVVAGNTIDLGTVIAQ